MPTPPAAATPQSGSTRAASMPAAASTSSFSAAGLGSTEPDPSVWSPEQQQQFMSALLGAAASGRLPMDGAEQQEARRRVASASSAASSTAVDSGAEPAGADDPMSALMAALQGGGDGAPPAFPFPGAAGMMPPSQAAPPKPKTLLQKLMPVVHIVCAWALLAYFVLWKEPEAYDAKTHGVSTTDGAWRRWAELNWKSPEDGWGVQTVVSPECLLRYRRPPPDASHSRSSGRSLLSRLSCTHGAYLPGLYVFETIAPHMHVLTGFCSQCRTQFGHQCCLHSPCHISRLHYPL